MNGINSEIMLQIMSCKLSTIDWIGLNIEGQGINVLKKGLNKSEWIIAY